MKILLLQLVQREDVSVGGNKTRRRRPNKNAISFYAVPASHTDTIGKITPLISDNLNFTGIDPDRVTSCKYSVPENAWRDDPSKQADWRKYQTLLNRARRVVGVHGAMFAEMEEAPPISAPLPQGVVTSFSDVGYMSAVENELDTQNEWDEGGLPAKPPGSSPVNGVLVRLARNNAVFFVPQDHLDKYLVTFTADDDEKKNRLAKILFGFSRKRKKDDQQARGSVSPRLTGVKNAFRSISDTTGTMVRAAPVFRAPADIPNPLPPTQLVSSFTDGGRLDLLEELRDFEEDFVNDDA